MRRRLPKPEAEASERALLQAPFLQFILRRRRLLIAALAVTAIQFLIFKLLYPYPDIFPDSHTYIDAAMNNALVSYRPLGYSLFLWVMFNLRAEDTTIVLVQYLVLQAAAFYFLSTLHYWYKLTTTVSRILFVFLLCNPFSLYLANYISSDPLFTGLSLWWFTGLIWIIHRPAMRQVLGQALLLVAILSIRYNALFYPLIAAVAFLLARAPAFWKLLGIASTMLFAYGFMRYTANVTFRETRTAVFSPFSGWQLANNALHVYPHVPIDSTDVPVRLQDLHRFVSVYFRERYDSSVEGADTRYLWAKEMPLKGYLHHYIEGRNINYFDGWVAMGPLYSDYGRWLILRHPLAFCRYYLLPNTRNYLLPALESFQYYNRGQLFVDPIVVDFFGYPSTRVSAVSLTAQRYIFVPFQILFLLLHIVFPILAIRRLRSRQGSRTVLLVLVFMIVNAGFCIFASPNVLRYMLFPIMLLFAFCLLAMRPLVEKVQGNTG